ncbi:MAG: hypothetical protein WBO46_14975 [Caldilineaceae bacterium]
MSARDFCTVQASTKRNASLGSGRTGAPAAFLASLWVTALWPVSRETVRLLDLASPREFKECFHIPAAGASLPDVVEGDVLVAGGVEYRIDHAAEWPDSDVPTLHLVVQKVKGT